MSSKASIVFIVLALAGLVVFVAGSLFRYLLYGSNDRIGDPAFVDYVTLFGFLLLWAGLILWFFFPFRRYADEHGWTDGF